jgi:hypothetical protein
MPNCVQLGSHPQTTGTGIYASVPGQDVLGLNPDNPSHYPYFALNTKMGRMANVIQAGVCMQDEYVNHPQIGGGSIPLVIFQRVLANGGFDPHEIARFLNTPVNSTVVENLSRWRIEQTAWSFAVRVNTRRLSDPITGAYFRYTVLNQAIN